MFDTSTGAVLWSTTLVDGPGTVVQAGFGRDPSGQVCLYAAVAYAA